MTHDTTNTETYKQGDERDPFTATLHDEDGNPVDLTNAQSATFILQEKTEFQNDTNTLAINATGTVVNATAGEVEYVIQEGDLDVAAGRYFGAWRVSWPDQGGDGVADDQWFPRDGLLAYDVERTPTGSVDPASAPADLTVTRLTASEIAGTVADGNVITNLVGPGSSVDGSGVLRTGYATVSVTAAYTASANEFVLADASGGAFSVTLPAPSADRVVAVEKTDTTSNTVTISPNGTESVNYGGSEDLVAQAESLELQSDGTDWFVL